MKEGENKDETKHIKTNISHASFLFILRDISG